MQPVGSLPCSQELSICPPPEPDHSIACLFFLFLKVKV